MGSAIKGLNIEDLKGIRIVLGSGSVRRKELLENLGLDVKVVLKKHIEEYPSSVIGAEIALYLSRSKAQVYKPVENVHTVVVTADTIVLCDGVVLGKPANREEAASMLKKLSGKTHEVVTGVTLVSSEREKSFSESTFVTFDLMSDQMIEFYVDMFSPLDKAGAYGIQEWIGTVACSRIEGSYLNVVGLPVQRLLREMQNLVMSN